MFTRLILFICFFLSVLTEFAAAADFTETKYVNVSEESARAMVALVDANGYRCKKVDMVSQCLTERCFRISCDLQWIYYIYESNKGGYEVRPEE